MTLHIDISVESPQVCSCKDVVEINGRRCPERPWWNASACMSPDQGSTRLPPDHSTRLPLTFSSCLTSRQHYNDNMSLSAEEENSELPASRVEENVKLEDEPQRSELPRTEHSTTPPSSPPVFHRTMASQSQDMPPPTAPASKARKRSRGEAAEVAINVPDSSSNLFNDLDPFSTQEQDQDATTNFTAANMPNIQNGGQTQSSQPAATSAQTAEVAHRQRKSEQRAFKNTAPKQSRTDPRSEEAEPESDMTTASNDPGLPEDQLDDYDWNELENRYHDRLAVLQDQERENFQELSNLISVMPPDLMESFACY